MRNTVAVGGRERVIPLDGEREGSLEAWNPGNWAYGQWINNRLWDGATLSLGFVQFEVLVGHPARGV